MGDSRTSEATPSSDYDYVVIGAGPAGLQMGYCMEKGNTNYVILEKGSGVGTFFRIYPRHRKLISINKNHNIFPEEEFNMRHDWNSLLCDNPDLVFGKYTDDLFPHTDFLVKYMEDFAEYYNLNIEFGTTVTRVSKKEGGGFILRTLNNHTYTCKRLIMATGPIEEKLPNIPGIHYCDRYSTHSLDLKDYVNKTVCIVGGGNSAFECGDHLAPVAGVIHYFLRNEKLKLAWDTHFVGDLRAVNNTTIDMYHLKSLIGFRNGMMKEITQDGNGLKVNFDMTLANWETPSVGHFRDYYDKIILCTGWKYIDEKMFDDDCTPETKQDGKFPILKESWETSVPDLYYCGTTMQARDRKAASGFIHGFRYCCRTLYHILMNKYHDIEFPKKSFTSLDLDEFGRFLVKRVSTTSALYQMNHGVLCDVIIFNDNRKKVGDQSVHLDKSNDISIDYYYELPTAWVEQQERFLNNKLMWVVRLSDRRHKYAEEINPSLFSKPPDLRREDAEDCGAFTAPFFDCYSNGKKVDTLSLGGSLVVRYDLSQLPGGNQDKSLNRVKNWLTKQLQLGPSVYDTSFFPKDKVSEVFTPWTDEQIKEYHERRLMKERSKPVKTCSVKVYAQV